MWVRVHWIASEWVNVWVHSSVWRLNSVSVSLRPLIRVLLPAQFQSIALTNLAVECVSIGVKSGWFSLGHVKFGLYSINNRYFRYLKMWRLRLKCCSNLSLICQIYYRYKYVINKRADNNIISINYIDINWEPENLIEIGITISIHTKRVAFMKCARKND